MKFSYIILLAFVLNLLSPAQGNSQNSTLPHVMAEQEFSYFQLYLDSRAESSNGITDPPEVPVRTMAEWEEIQSLVITWTQFRSILKQIVREAKNECEVIIVCSSQAQVENYLLANNAGGPPLDNLDNISYVVEDFDSIWMRDYGGNTIYKNDVDELAMVDWIYNRPRFDDDVIPQAIADFKAIDIYETTQTPYDLMATGGNFMTDGFGTAFSSELILDENTGGSNGWTNFPDHTEAEIDTIMSKFMGINTYINMEVLPYDAIHHIDMHMKLLDEETLLIGEYPQGVADGPQIEANIEYIMSNYNSIFGTPYKIIRVQMPPENGAYPNSNGDYRTYANCVFVNKTVLVPIYEEPYDSQGLAVLEAALPGYNIVGIECNDIIQLSGAIHCITKAVGVSDPLLISHQPLPDSENETLTYEVNASIQHKDGIANAAVYYSTTAGSGYVSVPMILSNPDNNTWTSTIPAHPFGSTIYYYIHAEASSGKMLNRPLPAPDGYWDFEINSVTGIDEISMTDELIVNIYPNPASAITVIQLGENISGNGRLFLSNLLGQEVQSIYDGNLRTIDKKFFIDASLIASGAYLVNLEFQGRMYSKKLMIR